MKTGRTGRIGHRGVATSFFTERDEPIASVLTRTLLETDQDIPEFLQSYVPEGEARENLKFEADSDFDPDEVAGGGGAPVWGATDDAGADAGGDTGNAWGGDASNTDNNENAGPSGGNAWGANDNAQGGDGDAWGKNAATNGGDSFGAGANAGGDGWGGGAASSSW